jgi:hypothetical protein
MMNGADNISATTTDPAQFSALEEENRKLKQQVERLKLMLRRQLNYDGDDHDFEHIFDRALSWEGDYNASDEEYNKTYDSAEETDPYSAADAEEKRRRNDTEGDSGDDARDGNNSEDGNPSEEDKIAVQARRPRRVSGLRITPVFEYAFPSSAFCVVPTPLRDDKPSIDRDK